MNPVFEVIIGVLRESALVLNESSPWMLLGFFVAAIIKAFVPDHLVKKHLGKPGASGVVKAALFGIPLPLCSCGVIPAAMGIRKQGASRGATVSFLVSTPETGVDSIAVTWALLDPIMTIFRPLAAFATAMVAGFLENVFGHKDDPIVEEANNGSKAPCCSSCGCSANGNNTEPVRLSLSDKLKLGFSEVFGDLLTDVGGWFLLGVLLAGIVSYVIPEDALDNYLGSGFLPMLVMLIVGIPLYICATASTPLAAALIMKGLSPGAALVFLIAGPATNAATMTLVGKFLGKRSLVIYIASIAVSALGFGMLLDFIYGYFGIDISPVLETAHEHCDKIFCTTHWTGPVSSLILLFFIIKGFIGGKK